jgi:hypothetical protein
MFLFTTPRADVAPLQDAQRATPHARAMQAAAERTGISFDYLARTAERESRFDASAKARTSSATGLFQFLDQTWLQMVKSEGPRLGLATEASAISDAGNGRLTVTDARQREAILKLRENPAAFAGQNRDTLGRAIGRTPTEGELYIAHFLGASGARDLIRLADSQPTAIAAQSFPDAAAANRSVFYDAGGRARTAGEVRERLVSGHSSAQAASPVQDQGTATDRQAVPFFRDSRPRGPLTGLFRNTGEPVAQGVRETWGGLARRDRPGAIGEATRVAFFPTAGAQDAAGAAQPTVAATASVATTTATRVTTVLPPQRTVESAASPANAAAPPKRQGKPGRQPLDLLSFLTPAAKP